MALHHDLLEQADHLARRELRRPRQASLRRAVSAGYYALFHLLIDESSRRLAPAQPASLRLQMRRAFTHSDMQEVCKQFGGGSPKQPTARLLHPVEPQLRQVALAFVELQAARHAADYDLSVSFDRIDVLQKVAQVRSAFSNWRSIRTSANATVFLAALLLQKQWSKA